MKTNFSIERFAEENLEVFSSEELQLISGGGEPGCSGMCSDSNDTDSQSCNCSNHNDKDDSGSTSID